MGWTPPLILERKEWTRARTWLARWLGRALVVAIVLCLPAEGAADTASVPKKVHVGVFVKQLRAISLKESQVVVDFHLWFRWTDDKLNPIDTFELINGTIDSKQNVYRAEVAGYHYASCRVLATLHKVWDTARYPLDAHTFTIEIEDNDHEADKLIYVPDADNSGLSAEAGVAGWLLQHGRAEVVTHTDRTNYGDISLPTGHESIWSRFIFSARVTRPGFGIFLKLFTGLFVATAIAIHGLLIPPNQIDARLGLAVGAVFAAVASEYLVASGLPESNELTLADQLHILSFLLIFITLAETVHVFKLALGGNEARAVRLDRVCFWTFLTVYIALAGVIVVR